MSVIRIDPIKSLNEKELKDLLLIIVRRIVINNAINT